MGPGSAPPNSAYRRFSCEDCRDRKNNNPPCLFGLFTNLAINNQGDLHITTGLFIAPHSCSGRPAGPGEEPSCAPGCRSPARAASDHGPPLTQALPPRAREHRGKGAGGDRRGAEPPARSKGAQGYGQLPLHRVPLKRVVPVLGERRPPQPGRPQSLPARPGHTSPLGASFPLMPAQSKGAGRW